MHYSIIVAVLVVVCAIRVSVEGVWILREWSMYIPHNSPSTDVRQKDATTPWPMVATFVSEEECRQHMEAMISRQRASLEQHGQPTSRSTAAGSGANWPF
jgi:hypothetical protein